MAGISNFYVVSLGELASGADERMESRSERLQKLVDSARVIVQHSQSVCDEGYVAKLFEDAMIYLRINPYRDHVLYCAQRPALSVLIAMFADAGVNAVATHTGSCPGSSVKCECVQPVAIAVRIPLNPS